MKKNLKKFVYLSVTVFVFVLLICFVFTGCDKDKAPKKPPIIEVDANYVRIDIATESYDIIGNVKAYDGYGKDISDRIKVAHGEGIIINEGKAIFAGGGGDYIFRYSIEDGGQAADAEVTVNARNIYSVYLTNATLPPLYCALDMAQNNYKFIFYNDREGTVDISAYGNRAQGTYPGSQEGYDSAVKKFYSIYENDAFAYFRMFFPDARNQMLLKVLVQKGIDENRYEVKYLSDGSMSYSTSFPYRDNNAYEVWQKNIDIYNNMYNLAENNEELVYNDVTLGNDLWAYELHNAYIVAAQKSNAEFWGAFPETLQSSDERVQLEIEKAHLIKKQPEEMYNALTSKQKEKFLISVSFNKSVFDENYFSDDGKYLVITGTNPVTGTFNSIEFLSILESICNDYRGYNILFKPHPAAIPTQTNYFEVYEYMINSGIKILPGRLPMEVISWVYSDVLIGGFDSSLYMAVPQGNTTFFIAQDKSYLSPVSLLLYESGIFGDINFYWTETK